MAGGRGGRPSPSFPLSRYLSSKTHSALWTLRVCTPQQTSGQFPPRLCSRPAVLHRAGCKAAPVCIARGLECELWITLNFKYFLVLSASHCPIPTSGWGQSNPRFWQCPSALRSAAARQPGVAACGLSPTYVKYLLRLQ